MICGYLDPQRDGVADYSLRLASQLRKVGIEPILLTSHAWADPDQNALGTARRWNILGVLQAARFLRRLDVDLVHVQFAPSLYNFTRAVGLLPAFVPRSLPLMVTLHEYGVGQNAARPHSWRSRLWSIAEHRHLIDRETLLLVPRAAALLVASEEHRGVLSSRFPAAVGQVRLVPIGLNVAVQVTDRTAARAGVREELGAPPDAPIVAFFGFLHPVKALDRLIEATAALRDSWPDIHLLLIGGAESHSVDEATARQIVAGLEQVSRDCGMTARVRITGYLPDPMVSRLLAGADVVALPFSDGVTSKSGSLLAAFAAGLPVVATAPPGQIHEPVEDGGVLRIPPEDTPALTAALHRVLSDRQLAERLRSAGRAVVASRSWDAIAEAHAEIYAGVLGTDAADTRENDVRSS